MARILIVEDDPDYLRQLKEWLSAENYHIESVEDGTIIHEKLMMLDQFDAVLLDSDIPNYSGISLLSEFRNAGGRTRVIMLFGPQNSLQEKMHGLESGADDFVTKPINPDELLARMRALLRRPAEFVGTILTSAYVTLDPLTGAVTKDGESIQLTTKERALLEFLMRHPKEVFSPEAILDHVWPTQSESSPLAVRVCINGLRNKLDKNPKASIIENVHGVGYRIRSD